VAIIRYGAHKDRQSNSWTLDFFRESCSKHLQLKVEERFEKLHRNEQGGITYFHIMMKSIMDMIDDVSKQAKELIRNFSLQKIYGEHVLYVCVLLAAIATILDQVNMLIEDHYNTILLGLTECSLPSFAEIFESLQDLKSLDLYNTQGLQLQ